MKILHHLLIFFQIMIPSLSLASSSIQKSTEQKIDNEIKELQIELEHTRKEALNQEIQAQTYMIDDWKKFVNDIQLNENNEKKIINIKKKIKELENQKKLT